MNRNLGGTEKAIQLPEGRQLSFVEYGPPAGKPVFYFHGSGGSRLDRPASNQVLDDSGVRLISIERPGHGNSTFQKGRRLLDWPKDIAQVADNLAIDKFWILGWSAGGPHALACAQMLPERILRAGLVACPAPMNRPGAFSGLPFPNLVLAAAARWFPGLTYLIRQFTRQMLLKDPETTTKRMMASIPKADQQALYTPENQAIFLESIMEGFRPGWQGVALDDILTRQDWGFPLERIDTSMDIWHGTDDVNVPVSAARYLANCLPKAALHLLPGEGHFFLLDHWGEILNTLVSN